MQRAGALNPRFALDIAGQIASALAAAAKLRLVHRDLKPSNVMLIRTGDGKASAKLIDFGVGLLLDPQTAEESARLTQAGLIGTAHFASPEQLRGQSVDARSDIYSLRHPLVHADRPNAISRSVIRSGQKPPQHAAAPERTAATARMCRSVAR